MFTYSKLVSRFVIISKLSVLFQANAPYSRNVLLPHIKRVGPAYQRFTPIAQGDCRGGSIRRAYFHRDRLLFTRLLDESGKSKHAIPHEAKVVDDFNI